MTTPDPTAEPDAGSDPSVPDLSGPDLSSPDLSSPDLSSSDLSVIVVTPLRFEQLRRTVRHLREQDAADRCELVVVAPTVEAVDDARPGELDGFASVQVVPVGPIPNVDKAAIHGIRAASAPAVALIEDHAFTQPGWAAAIIKAYADPDHAVVGSAILNGNPTRMLSWQNLLIAYGPWTEPAVAGDCATLPGHNITYRRDVLLAFGDELEGMLGREGGLHEALQAAGHRFVLEPAAKIAHVNPSLVSASVDLRFSAGRLYGATRAERGDWSRAKRLIYVVLGPAIPFLRFARLWQAFFTGGRRAELVPRVLPALFAGLVLDGLGQMVGYAAGPGGTFEKLSTFEMDRLQHITVADRRAIAE